MRFLPILLYLLVALAIGCNPEGDKIYNTYNYYYPEDTTTVPDPDTTEDHSIQVTYPANDEIIELWYDWIEDLTPSPYYCPWGYSADTTVYAELSVDIPGTIVEARVFVRSSPNGSFNQTAVIPYPGVNQIFARVFQYSSSFTSSTLYDQNLAFWVSLTSDDSTNYISPTVSFKIKSRVNYDFETIPETPAMDSVYEHSSQQRLYIEWCPRSPNVDSFRVAIRDDATGDVVRFAWTGLQNGLTYIDYVPLTDYSVWVTAENEYGSSAASDMKHITTQAPVLPDNFEASIRPGAEVRLSWSNHAYPDSVLVSRRDTLNDWTAIKSLGCSGTSCPSSWSDTTGTTSTVYYYRLGIQYSNGIWWSSDSIGVWIP
ncbi:MAG: hypothetical protein KDB65_10595 [Calditrichaeota bacterium]|nr:hypothetical protein [Calditrichota bacterium]MCB9367639.1 hypothetical protein [Calditrichota bacterium]